MDQAQLDVITARALTEFKEDCPESNQSNQLSFLVSDNYETGGGSTVSILITNKNHNDAVKEFNTLFGDSETQCLEFYTPKILLTRYSTILPPILVDIIQGQNNISFLHYFSQIHHNYV